MATYSGGTTNFLHADWLGTKRVMTALNGTTSLTCTGFAFGDGVNCPGTNWTYNGFTDDVHDPETNLEHTLFRQYSGTEGRWLTPDPAGLAAAAPGDPQSWNQYSYVENNATNAFDPLGPYCPTEFPDRGHIYCTPYNSIGIGCDLPWSIGGFGGGSFDPLHDSLGCVTSFAPGGPCIPIASLSDQLAALLAQLPWNNPCVYSVISDYCGFTNFTQANGSPPTYDCDFTLDGVSYNPQCGGHLLYNPVNPFGKTEIRGGQISDACSMRADQAFPIKFGAEDATTIGVAALLGYLLPGGGKLLPLLRGAVIGADAKYGLKSDLNYSVYANCLNEHRVPAPPPAAFF